MEEEGPPEGSERGSPDSAKFGQKIVYVDGFEVEVTKITNGKLTDSEAEYESNAKPGDGYTIFTVRARNGTKDVVELYESMTLYYGADGTEAETIYLDKAEGDLQGKLLPGKARTGKEVFLIPAKERGDVTLEVTVSSDHESAVFTGNIK